MIRCALSDAALPAIPEPVFTHRSSSTWCEQGGDVIALASKSHHQAFVFSARPFPFGADLWMGSEG